MEPFDQISHHAGPVRDVELVGLAKITEIGAMAEFRGRRVIAIGSEGREGADPQP